MLMRFFRLTVPVTVVAYLLATMGIIGTHEHHHGPATAPAVAQTDAGEHSHSHSHGGHSHTHSHGSHSHHHHAAPEGVATTEGATPHQHCPGCPSHGPLEDDDCAVCK